MCDYYNCEVCSFFDWPEGVTSGVYYVTPINAECWIVSSNVSTDVVMVDREGVLDLESGEASDASREGASRVAQNDRLRTTGSERPTQNNPLKTRFPFAKIPPSSVSFPPLPPPLSNTRFARQSSRGSVGRTSLSR